MNIAVIGWGSLIWKPEGNNPPGTQLKLESQWYKRGPLLPVEFARQSSGNRLTLVICEDLPPQPTLCAKSGYLCLQDAIQNLMKREGTEKEDHIHYVDKIGKRAVPGNGFDVDIVQEWLDGLTDVDAAIWTGLPPRFNRKTRVPTPDEAIDYLKGLRGADLASAETYIRKAPEIIRTSIRHAVEDELGWLPIPLPEGTFADEPGFV